MAKQRMSKKKKIILISVAAVLVVAIVVVAILQREPPVEVDYVTAYQGPIAQNINVSGTIESANQTSYEILGGVKVKDVKVRTGDKVSKGDVLVTFDPASLNQVVAQKQEAYNQAVSEYNNAQINASSTATNSTKNEKKENTTQAEKEPKKKEEPQEIETLSDLLGSLLNAGVSGINSAVDLLEGLASGDLLNFNLGSQVDLSSMMEGVDLSSMMEGVDMGQINNLLSSTYEAAVEATKKDLESTKSVVKKMEAGWVAPGDGIVREIKVKAGETFVSENSASTQTLDTSSLMNMMSGDTSALTDMIGQMGSTQKEYGLMLECYPFEATFVLNKYDILKIHLDQPATIKTHTGAQLPGYVSYISPVADDSSDLNISSILGSTSTTGVKAKVTIPEPDESTIIGLDASIAITISEKQNALLAPIEALRREEDGRQYVWVVEEDSGKISKAYIETGLSSDTVVEITSGCKDGDILIKSPPATLTAESRVTPKEQTTA